MSFSFSISDIFYPRLWSPRWTPVFFSLGLVVLTGCYAGHSPINPSDKKLSKLQTVVEQSAQTIQKMRSSPNNVSIERFLGRAHGVLIFPRMIKAGFIYGAEGGTGVLLARNDTGEWSGPAFYSFGGGSFGLQAGMQQGAIVLVFMNKSAFESSIPRGWTLGMDATVAAGPNGLSSELSTFSENKDIYYFSDVGGIFAGLSFEGGVISPRTKYNLAYYGTNVTPWAILIDKKIDKPETQLLKDALTISDHENLSR